MEYSEALNFIHSVNNYFCKPGLERIKSLCEYLGNPQDKLKFIHVAGTNGKGSFCSMLTSVLKNAGYRVGTYTSPYILNFNERITINGEMISNGDLSELCELIKPFCDSAHDKPTEFEVITAIGFEYFRRQNCDVVVLECGLGGKLDATNIIKKTILSVITGVDFDHQNFLGDTITQISSEKAGIIKKDVPCLWCGNNDEAETVIKQAAALKGSKLFSPEHNLLNILNADLSGTTFDFKGYKTLYIPLLGLYQPINAANVVTACEILNKLGLEISTENIYEGLKNSQWHARFELLLNSPTVIFDGAHNTQGIIAATNSIEQYFPYKKVNILTGVMADKDYTFIAKTVSEVANKVYCITPDNPRALPASDFAKVFKNLGVTALAFQNIEEAVATAINECIANGMPLIALGSLYMYSDIYNEIKEKKQQI